jgi:long-chain acyl-CoA synthetase
MFYSRFLQSVELWPDAVAVEIQRQPVVSGQTPGAACCSEDSRDSYTYRQLRQRAESVGAWLQRSGLQPGARCAILANNSPDWVAVYLGIVAAGHTAVPLDTAFNCEQVEKLLHDCGASLIFADAKHLPIARHANTSQQLKVALIDGPDVPPQPELPGLREMYQAGAGGFTPSSARPDDVACILYTSGTTSDPKGVMLSHANLRGEMESVFRFVRFDYTDAILGVLPLFHALAQMANLMIPLACGARVVFLEALNTTELLRALTERNITLFCCVPQFFYLIHERVFQEARKRGTIVWTAFRMMLALSRIGRTIGLNPGKIFFKQVHTLLGPKMRYLVTGGSRFDVAIGRDFHALGFDILQAYGLTETTGGALVTPPESNVIGSVGKPLPGNEAKIVDAKPAEDGSGHMVGEIAIRGPIVMKGYYNRPEATAEVIRNGWLHTGDLGYSDPGGNIFIAGRQKEIIVLSSGKNIYPEEIESYYLKSPWIKEACVMGLEGAPGDPVSERLHAVIVPNLDVLRQKKVVNMREVIRYDVENISSHLPATKRILSYDIWQEDLPRTTTRKLRRFEIESRVRQMQASGARDSEGQLARELTDEESDWMSQSEVQQAIAIVRAAAKNSVVKVHPRDNLELDLGLDSMERVELLVQLEHHLAADVDDSAASEVYTVRELIDLVRGNMGKGATQAVGWETLLATESTDPEVLAIAKERPITGRLWYLFGRTVNLLAKDVFHLKISGIEKLPPNGPFILCANHQSYLDAPVLTAAMPWHIFRDLFYVGDSEKFGTGPARTIARFLRLIPVDPDANLVPAMRAGAYGLRHGKILVLYPEGERSIDGFPKSFKKGAAILSRHLNVPIVPVAQDGFFEAWPRGGSFQRFAPLRIQIGDPIYPDPAEPPEAAYNRLTAEARQRIVSMWEELHSPQPQAKPPASDSAAEKHHATHP